MWRGTKLSSGSCGVVEVDDRAGADEACAVVMRRRIVVESAGDARDPAVGVAPPHVHGSTPIRAGLVANLMVPRKPVDRIGGTYETIPGETIRGSPVARPRLYRPRSVEVEHPGGGRRSDDRREARDAQGTAPTGAAAHRGRRRSGGARCQVVPEAVGDRDRGRVGTQRRRQPGRIAQLDDSAEAGHARTDMGGERGVPHDVAPFNRVVPNLPADGRPVVFVVHLIFPR